MFMKRILASLRKSLFRKQPAAHDGGVEGSIVLKRLRELMEMTPEVPATASSDASAGGEHMNVGKAGLLGAKPI
jgi:hypothetical protein